MRRLSALLAVCSLGACVIVPPGPSVMVLPGSGKSFDQFRTDDRDCRRGMGGAGTLSNVDQQRYDTDYMQCMYVKGHRIPLAGQMTDSATSGRSQGTSMPPPPTGMSSPPPVGTPPASP